MGDFRGPGEMWWPENGGGGRRVIVITVIVMGPDVSPGSDVPNAQHGRLQPDLARRSLERGLR